MMTTHRLKPSNGIPALMSSSNELPFAYSSIGENPLIMKELSRSQACPVVMMHDIGVHQLNNYTNAAAAMAMY